MGGRTMNIPEAVIQLRNLGTQEAAEAGLQWASEENIDYEAA